MVTTSAAPTLITMVSRWVAATPRAIAVRQDEETRCYADLGRSSDRIAALVAAFGLASESPVGVLVDRTVDTPAILLGIMKAGCTCLPLDPSHPVQRIGHMLADAGARVVITDRHQHLVADHEIAVVQHSSDLLPGQGPAARPVPEQHPSGACCLLFTSGSTGRPKAVVLTHGGLLNCLRVSQRNLRFNSGDRLLAVTTITFDIAMLEMFLPLVSGGETIMTTTAQSRDGVALAEIIDRWRPRFLHATPVTWQMLLMSGWLGDHDLTAMCGGELVPPTLAARLLACTGTLWHLYGPSEASLYAICTRIDPGPVPGKVPIGRPISATRAYLLDADLQPADPGTVGELYLGGAAVARGYHGQPGLTADRFRPDPLVAGARMYRTGDLASTRPDGDLDLHGRNDRQVKIRGQRVELGEIEAVLMGHHDTELAAVAVTGETQEDRSVVAFLQLTAPLRQSVPRTVHGISAYAKSRLAPYMVPSSYAVLAAMPLTPHGKVDRLALGRISPAEPSVPVPPARPGQPGRALAKPPELRWIRQAGTLSTLVLVTGSRLSDERSHALARAMEPERPAGCINASDFSLGTACLAEFARLAAGRVVLAGWRENGVAAVEFALALAAATGIWVPVTAIAPPVSYPAALRARSAGADGQVGPVQCVVSEQSADASAPARVPRGRVALYRLPGSDECLLTGDNLRRIAGLIAASG